MTNSYLLGQLGNVITPCSGVEIMIKIPHNNKYLSCIVRASWIALNIHCHSEIGIVLGENVEEYTTGYVSAELQVAI